MLPTNFYVEINPIVDFEKAHLNHRQFAVTVEDINVTPLEVIIEGSVLYRDQQYPFILQKEGVLTPWNFLYAEFASLPATEVDLLKEAIMEQIPPSLAPKINRMALADKLEVLIVQDPSGVVKEAIRKYDGGEITLLSDALREVLTSSVISDETRIAARQLLNEHDDSVYRLKKEAEIGSKRIESELLRLIGSGIQLEEWEKGVLGIATKLQVSSDKVIEVYQQLVDARKILESGDGIKIISSQSKVSHCGPCSVLKGKVIEMLSDLKFKRNDLVSEQGLCRLAELSAQEDLNPFIKELNSILVDAKNVPEELLSQFEKLTNIAKMLEQTQDKIDAGEINIVDKPLEQIPQDEVRG